MSFRIKDEASTWMVRYLGLHENTKAYEKHNEKGIICVITKLSFYQPEKISEDVIQFNWKVLLKNNVIGRQEQRFGQIQGHKHGYQVGGKPGGPIRWLST